MKIIIDQRERNSQIIAELIFLNADIEVKHLPLADYIINDEIAIERKTVNDFVGSMINRRMLDQLSDLKKNYAKPLLLLEGIDEEDIYKPSQHPNINENAIRGMILSISLDFGIPIIFTKDFRDSAKYLHLLAKRQDRPEKEMSLVAKRKAFSLAEQQQIIIEGFPGVGPNLAKNVLRHFGSIKKIINADMKELTKVEKIGKKKAETIKRIVEESYKEE